MDKIKVLESYAEFDPLKQMKTVQKNIWWFMKINQ
jgi:hypothetical protein